MEQKTAKNSEKSETIKGFFKFFEKFQTDEMYNYEYQANKKKGVTRKKRQGYRNKELDYADMEYDHSGYEVR